MSLVKTQAHFTMHAMTRTSQYGLTAKELVGAWFKASHITLSEKMKAYKFTKYGMDSLDNFYLYHKQSDLLFTCKPMEGYTLIITVTKMREANG